MIITLFKTIIVTNKILRHIYYEICARGKREKLREKPTQTPFRPPRNPHGVTETRTRDPSGGRRVSNRLRHEAALFYYIIYILSQKW